MGMSAVELAIASLSSCMARSCSSVQTKSTSLRVRSTGGARSPSNLDPDAHGASGTEERANVGCVLARRPGLYFRVLESSGTRAFVCALVSEDDDLGPLGRASC